MTKPLSNKQADEFLDERMSLIQMSLGQKAREYTRGDDRLYNFNKGAVITGQTRERYMLNLTMKHIVSVMDMVDDLDKGAYIPNAYAEEKLGDIINYMILLEMSFKHRNI